MDAATPSRAPRRTLPAAWRVVLALGGICGLFGLVAWMVRPTVVDTLLGEVQRRILRLDGVVSNDYLIALAAALLIDAVALGWRRSALMRLGRASRSARADMLLSAMVVLGWWPFVLTFFSAGWMWVVQQGVHRFIHFDLLGAIDQPWLKFLAVLLVTDFFGYWTHRISHDWDFLWEAHQYHHAADELTILTGLRDHPVEDVFQYVVVAIPLAALGAPVTHYVLARIVLYVVDLFQHSMVPWTYGWVGRWILYSPVGHRIHHSPKVRHHLSNYGNMFVFWDRMFGTWYRGTDVNEEVGLPHHPYNRQGVITENFHLVLRMVRSIRRSSRTGRWRTGPGSAPQGSEG